MSHRPVVWCRLRVLIWGRLHRRSSMMRWKSSILKLIRIGVCHLANPGSPWQTSPRPTTSTSKISVRNHPTQIRKKLVHKFLPVLEIWSRKTRPGSLWPRKIIQLGRRSSMLNRQIVSFTISSPAMTTPIRWTLFNTTRPLVCSKIRLRQTILGRGSQASSLGFFRLLHPRFCQLTARTPNSSSTTKIT